MAFYFIWIYFNTLFRDDKTKEKNWSYMKVYFFKLM